MQTLFILDWKHSWVLAKLLKLASICNYSRVNKLRLKCKLMINMSQFYIGAVSSYLLEHKCWFTHNGLNLVVLLNFFRYVSSDFGNHPLSHLMGSVFGLHNRDNIEVINLIQFLYVMFTTLPVAVRFRNSYHQYRLNSVIAELSRDVSVLKLGGISKSTIK